MLSSHISHISLGSLTFRVNLPLNGRTKTFRSASTNFCWSRLSGRRKVGAEKSAPTKNWHRRTKKSHRQTRSHRATEHHRRRINIPYGNLSQPVLFLTGCRLTSRSLGGEVSHDGDFMIFEGNRYSRKGFLFKSFAMSAVVRRLNHWLWHHDDVGYFCELWRNDATLESVSSHPR